MFSEPNSDARFDKCEDTCESYRSEYMSVMEKWNHMFFYRFKTAFVYMDLKCMFQVTSEILLSRNTNPTVILQQ